MTLTVTDVGGNTGVISHDVTVVGPPPPAPPPRAQPRRHLGRRLRLRLRLGLRLGSGSGRGRTPPPGKPVAKAAVMSHTLSSALRKGLAIGYSVNEQVAGRFEVLLARTLAHKLKISGTPATGLPAGTPPQLVIAKAILVTTKGGHSTCTIKFSQERRRRACAKCTACR